jgi:predicted acyl esterase
MVKHYLSSNSNLLTLREPVDHNASSIYHVDFEIGSSVMSRWQLLKQFSTKSLRYDQFNISRMLSFYSEPMTNDTEVAGNAIVHLDISVNKPDAAVFVYLLDYDPQTKRVRYMTETHLRLAHRKLQGENELNIRRTFRHADASAMPVDEKERVVMFMQPVGYLVPKGHQVVVSIAGYDKDNFDNAELHAVIATEFRVFDTSYIEIPFR